MMFGWTKLNCGSVCELISSPPSPLPPMRDATIDDGLNANGTK